MTPPLDGTFLPGVTRASVLALLSHYSPNTTLSRLPAYMCICTAERAPALSDLFAAPVAGMLLESWRGRTRKRDGVGRKWVPPEGIRLSIMAQVVNGCDSFRCGAALKNTVRWRCQSLCVEWVIWVMLRVLGWAGRGHQTDRRLDANVLGRRRQLQNLSWEW